MKRAVISLGTNTARLLVAHREPDGTLEPIEHHAVGTRLGAGVRERGPLDPAAAERTLEAVAAFVARVRELDAAPVAIATSALRRADDAAAFAARVEALAGAPLHVLDGEAEAQASFRGATARAPRDGRYRAVLDVGGGSTECAGGRDGVVDRARSVEIGSVRLTERFPALGGAAPGAAAREAALRARAVAADALGWLADWPAVAELRCVAGTPLTVAAVAAGTTVDDAVRATLARDDVENVVARLLELPLAERRALPGMVAQRADILPAGGIIVAEAMSLLAVESALVEVDDLLLGYLMEVEERGEPGTRRHSG